MALSMNGSRSEAQVPVMTAAASDLWA